MAEKITHDGELNLSGQKIPCYVTENGIRVLSGRQMQQALMLINADYKGEQSGSRLQRFLSNRSLINNVFNDLTPDHFPPIKAMLGRKIIHGYKAELLVDICDRMLDARKEGLLTRRQVKIANQCEILMRAFARVGIIALVDEATGYQDVRIKNALAKILEEFIAKELQPWTRTFPLEFYREIYRLKTWSFPELANGKKPRTPSVLGIYTNDIVYKRLAPGVFEELRKNRSCDSRERTKDLIYTMVYP